MKDVTRGYIKRRECYDRLIKKQNKNINVISNLRLVDAVAAILTFILLYRSGQKEIACITLGLYIVIFIYLIIIHNREINRKKYLTSLRSINDRSSMRFSDEWKNFSDTGEEFKDESHPFSGDLDIFGRASLFQWINTGRTRAGRKKLGEFLTKEAENTEEIVKRQASVRELSEKLWWRQRFEADGMAVSEAPVDEEGLYRWTKERNELYNMKLVRCGIILLPAVTISTVVLSYGLALIPTVVSKILVLIHLVLLFIGSKKRNAELELVYKYRDSIKIYSSMLKHFEKHSFKTSYIKELKNRLLNENGTGASQEIRRLEKIVESMLNRRNIMFFPLNLLLLWDYHIMTSLDKWKGDSGHILEEVIEVIGTMEALSSLAVIGYDHRDWSVPVFTEKPSVYRATAIGHPLITRGRVYNDLEIIEPTGVLLITGSNMSGKTTFLRTSGINLVLAYAGASVCASSMECSIMKIYTCMRIGDNLDKNISSFYAELLRISSIVRASEDEGQVFFLLDEIFKGTNSSDRHTGARAVIKRLYENGAVGMVSTHDLELGELEKESGSNIKNYHFQEYYEGNEIRFDYKLRPGISTTRNALYLIRMAGIDM